MPSENQSADTSDRERFPEVKVEIGEDPARYLDRPLMRDTSETSGGKALAVARIKGIKDPGVAAAWLAVERRLERGPRDAIEDVLIARIEKLRATDLPGGIDRTRWPECIDELPERDTSEIPEKDFLPDEDETLTADEKLAKKRAVADGGEDRDE